MMTIQILENSLKELINGNISCIKDSNFCIGISNLAVDLISNPIWNTDQQHVADLILRISNIAYNNTSIDTLPLDDGIYDQLLVLYSKYNPNYQIGAIPIKFNEEAQNEITDEKVMCTTIDLDSKMYIRDILNQHTPIHNIRPVNMCFKVTDPITKRLINTEHKYPELVGTLDKCKFVLNNDANIAGVLDKPSVQVFERDFIHKCIDNGVISTNEVFEMIGELKYDGVSVEAEVCGDTIISALSRGDTADNIATDLTPIFGGYKFPFASKVPNDIKFGIKFEAVILKHDLQKMGQIRGKEYKNCRNAIIGLLGSSDANKFIDYITLMPLATSLDMDRIEELKFLNHYYNSGQYNRYCLFKGNYQQILYQVKQFTESAEEIRNILPYMIDGVVISFIDKKKIKTLGRINSVNKYSIAIKFNPKKVRTIFIGYTYSVGKSGDIIPMAHFKPCEFIGGIHTKQTIHSYKRFKDLNLAKGEQIDLDYVNDVITYVTKPDTEFNRSINTEPEQFITNCPFCGEKIVISESGKSAKCPNVNCHERQIMRMIDMIDRLGFKDFAEESVRSLNLTSFVDLLNIPDDVLYKTLGPNNAISFKNYLNNLLNTKIPDYKLMSAFSFDGMADETWKVVLKQYTINELLNMNNDDLYSNLKAISGIGPKTINAIIYGKDLYKDEISIAMHKLSNNIINSKGLSTGPRVAITGFRDNEFINILNKNGFDASDKYSVTKDTSVLITNDKNSLSSKIKKANKYNIPIFTKQEFIDNYKIKI